LELYHRKIWINTTTNKKGLGTLTKVKEYFELIKSLRNILEGLKSNVDIFREIKNIFNQKKMAF